MLKFKRQSEEQKERRKRIKDLRSEIKKDQNRLDSFLEGHKMWSSRMTLECEGCGHNKLLCCCRSRMNSAYGGAIRRNKEKLLVLEKKEFSDSLKPPVIHYRTYLSYDGWWEHECYVLIDSNSWCLTDYGDKEIAFESDGLKDVKKFADRNYPTYINYVGCEGVDVENGELIKSIVFFKR